jgi:hypothetical protein
MENLYELTKNCEILTLTTYPAALYFQVHHESLDLEQLVLITPVKDGTSPPGGMLSQREDTVGPFSPGRAWLLPGTVAVMAP